MTAVVARVRVWVEADPYSGHCHDQDLIVRHSCLPFVRRSLDDLILAGLAAVVHAQAWHHVDVHRVSRLRDVFVMITPSAAARRVQVCPETAPTYFANCEEIILHVGTATPPSASLISLAAASRHV